ncbi:MAG: hypothetical protein RSF33_08560, partial [Hydrogenoanaerobacterium sp.]
MTGNSKLKAALIVVSVLMVVSTCVGGYLYWDMQGEKAKALETASIYQAEIAKALETASTYQAEIDKLSAKVQEQTDLVSKQSKLI